jgi:hypothetical protein
MLQRIYLNHAFASRQHNPLAIGLLLTGMVAAVALFLFLQQLDRRQSLLEEDMLRLRQPQASQTMHLDGKENAGKREEIAAVQAVLAELALPWQPLFTALEKRNLPEVKLLAVEPHPKRHKLRMTAEAQDVGYMLDYVDSLHGAPILGDVFLLSHEYKTDGGPMPIRFVVEAAWLF